MRTADDVIQALRQHHAALSPIWRHSILGASFASRHKKISGKSSDGILVLLAQRSEKDVAYCVSSISGSAGEIDSVFVAEAHRGKGLGACLISRALQWLDGKQVDSVAVTVLSDNHEASEFYARHGFHPRSVRLLKVDHHSSAGD